MRRSFAVTFTRDGDPAVLDCLHRLDALTAELRALARGGKCNYADTIEEVLEPLQTISYVTVLQYAKEDGRFGTNRSRITANIMQTLFDMRRPDGSRAVRFYCRSYHHLPEACNCPSVTRMTTTSPHRIRLRMISVTAVARGWLIDRDDVLALTEELFAALKVHPSTRQYAIDFVTWLRANPQAR